MKKITCSFIKDKKLLGFTLAEVLITLTIIGVVAALTIPSLLANVNDKTYSTKRQAFATRIAQAVSQIGMLNAYEAKPPKNSSEDPIEYARDNSSMNFIVEALSKVYKITNVCEFEKYAACDFPNDYTYMHSRTKIKTLNYPYLNNHNANANADKLGGIVPKAAFFRTKNGESAMLYYNPRCVAEQPVGADNTKVWMKEVCAWIIFDLDGAKKGPNVQGKDIGLMTILYPDTPYVAYTHTIHTGAASAPSYGTTTNVDSVCVNTAVYGYPKGSGAVPSREEIYTLAFHTGFVHEDFDWSSNIEGSGPDDYAWAVARYGIASLFPRKETHRLLCVVRESNLK